MNKKQAFTLPELLLTMVIIGLVCTFGFKTLQYVDKNAIYSYSNTFHSLDKALYNAMNFTSLPSPFEGSQKDENGVLTSLSNADRAARMCKLLTEFINTNDNTCNNSVSTSSLTNGFANIEPSFVAHNGVRFYISEMFTIGEDADAHSFFLVFADINGKKNPNSMEYVPNTKDPDIFAFAALDIGRVCPLGPPEIDPKFMKTRVSYYVQEEKNKGGSEENKVTEMVEKFSSPSKPYYISKAEAWGYYQGSDYITPDFYIEDEPFTYNGIVRKTIKDSPVNSMIYGFLNDGELQVPNGITIQTPIEGGDIRYNCSPGSAVNCEVIIDKYLY